MRRLDAKVGLPVSFNFKRQDRPVQTYYGYINSIDEDPWITIEVAEWKKGEKSIAFVPSRLYSVKTCLEADIILFDFQRKTWSMEAEAVK